MRCEMHDVLERHDKRFVDEQFELPMREPTPMLYTSEQQLARQCSSRSRRAPLNTGMAR